MNFEIMSDGLVVAEAESERGVFTAMNTILLEEDYDYLVCYHPRNGSELRAHLTPTGVKYSYLQGSVWSLI